MERKTQRSKVCWQNKTHFCVPVHEMQGAQNMFTVFLCVVGYMDVNVTSK